MAQQVRFCTARDGVGLAYAVHGSGPPIVRAATWLTHLDFDWESPASTEKSLPPARRTPRRNIVFHAYDVRARIGPIALSAKC